MQRHLHHLQKNYGGVLAASVTALFAFIIYWLTLAPDITWANYGVDGGDLITAVVTQGNPHPSGYPTYLILGYFVNKLPLWPIAFRFNLFSAVTMASAAGFVAATVHYLVHTQNQEWQSSKSIISIAIGLTFAFAPLIWGQAIITEVYSLYMMLCAAFLWALLTQKPVLLTGILCGLTITAHSTGLLLLPIAFVLTKRNKLIYLATGILLGLIPYLLLPLLVTPSSPVIWGDLSTLKGWWWLISSQIYSGYRFGLPVHLWLSRLAEWGLIIGPQFTWAGFPLIIIALFIAKSESRRLYLLLSLTAVLYFFAAFFYHTNDAIIFTLPAWLMLSLCLIPIYEKLGWLSLFLPLTLILINFQANNLRGNDQLRRHAESLLMEVPEQAILETPGDPTIFALWYMIYAEEQRKDIIPIDNQLFAFAWYRDNLRLLHPDLSGLEKDDLTLFRKRNQSARPYCFASLAQIHSNTDTNYSLTCLENASS